MTIKIKVLFIVTYLSCGINGLQAVSAIPKHFSSYGKDVCVNGDLICMAEKVAFEVFSELHSEIDDDKDGGLEPNEAHGYAVEELKYKDIPSRAKKFNKHDNHISKQELWLKWKESMVYKWSGDDVRKWLKNEVELPEYVYHFRRQKIDGMSLPKIAMKNMYYLTHILKIPCGIHRQKLRLKAIDLILFGPPKNKYNHLKDVLFMIFMAITLTLSCLAYQKYNENEICLKELTKQLDSLTESENSLNDLTEKLESLEEKEKMSLYERESLKNEYEMEIKLIRQKAKNVSLERLQTEEKIEKLRLAKEEVLYVRNMLEKTKRLHQKNFSLEFMILLLQMSYEIDMFNCSFKLKKRDDEVHLVKDLISHGVLLEENFSCLLSHEEMELKWKSIEKMLGMKLFPTPGLSNIRHSLLLKVKPEYQRFYGKAKPFKVNFPETLPTVEEFDDYDGDHYYDNYFQCMPMNMRHENRQQLSRSSTMNSIETVTVPTIRPYKHVLNSSASCSAISNLHSERSDIRPAFESKSTEIIGDSGQCLSSSEKKYKKKKNGIKKAFIKHFKKA